MWLNIWEIDMQNLDDFVQRLADIVQPIPIAVLRDERCIVIVHDGHSSVVASHNNDRSNESDADQFCPSPSSLASSQSSSSGSSFMAGHQSSQGVGESDSTSYFISSDSPGNSPNRNSLVTNGLPQDPQRELPPSNTTNDIPIPFVAVLTVEDCAKIQQSIKIVFGLEVETNGQQRTAVSRTTIDYLQLILDCPLLNGQPISPPSRIPHLRPQQFRVKVQPSLSPDEHTFIYQQPDQLSFVRNVTNGREMSANFRSTIAANPSLQVEVSRVTSHTIERIPLTQIIDTDRMFIGESHGVHIWEYPFNWKQTHQSSLVFPTHSSTFVYSTEQPLEAITVTGVTCLETNPKARPSQPVSLFRTPRRVLSLGYKHVKMSFTVEVKRDRRRFLELRGQDCVGSTVRLHHKLPSSDTGGKTSTENKLAHAHIRMKAS